MIKAMLLAMSASSYSGETPITCVFPSLGAHQKSLRIVLDPKPSLKDQPGLYRVMIDFGSDVTIRAAAQPLHTTEADDILIRGGTRNKQLYTIGLRADGYAAFNIRNLGGGNEVDKRTRIGECHGHEAHVARWLSS